MDLGGGEWSLEFAWALGELTATGWGEIRAGEHPGTFYYNWFFFFGENI